MFYGFYLLRGNVQWNCKLSYDSFTSWPIFTIFLIKFNRSWFSVDLKPTWDHIVYATYPYTNIKLLITQKYCLLLRTVLQLDQSRVIPKLLIVLSFTRGFFLTQMNLCALETEDWTRLLNKFRSLSKIEVDLVSHFHLFIFSSQWTSFNERQSQNVSSDKFRSSMEN